MAQDSFLMENIIMADARNLLDNQADVSMNLAKHIVLNYAQDSNLVFSPISIQVILGLIAAGSGAQTLEQLLCFLKADSVDDLNHLYSHLVALVFTVGKDENKFPNSPCLSFANGVWLDESVSLKPHFKHVVDSLYKADSHRFDFAKRADDVINFVNSWVNNETRGLIKEILSRGSVNESTRLIFTNALYFKGAWDEGFDKYRTRDSHFFLLSGGSVKVPFMTNSASQRIRIYDGFKVLNLPYKRDANDQRSFSMCIFLPDATDGLPALIERAGSESGFLERHIPNWPVDVRMFMIPKFKYEYDIEVSKMLQKLGLVLPFEDVGVTEMIDTSEPYYVSKIFQKAFIEVNEEGTEAAAVTCVSMYCPTGPCYKPMPIDFVADHPFLFVIRENATGIVQFIGHVLNPSQT